MFTILFLWLCFVLIVVEVCLAGSLGGDDGFMDEMTVDLELKKMMMSVCRNSGFLLPHFSIPSSLQPVELEESIPGAGGIIFVLNKNAPVLRKRRRWQPVTGICTRRTTATRRPLRT